MGRPHWECGESPSLALPFQTITGAQDSPSAVSYAGFLSFRHEMSGKNRDEIELNRIGQETQEVRVSCFLRASARFRSSKKATTLRTNELFSFWPMSVTCSA